MGAKQIRIARLFNAQTGRAVNIPVDHGSVLGNVMGLTDPVAVLKQLIDLGIDSTLMNKGLAKITENLFESKTAPGRVLTADMTMMGSVPGTAGCMTDHEPVVTVEEAVRGNFDCMKVLLVWGIDQPIMMKSLKFIATLAGECDKWNMPLMVEPVFWGEAIPPEKRGDPELLEHGTRIALEIGADVLKLPYSGDKKGFADLVRRMHVPVVILGGPKMNDLRAVLQVARDSTDAGSRGVVFGRNVWQHPQMPDVVRALQDIVHKGADVDKAMAAHGLK